MRTTIDLPKELVEEVMHESKVKTKTSAIILSLKEYLRRRKLDKLRGALGTMDLNIDLKKSRAR